MTTQINIVVDDGGLIQRNKEQTDGNRWLTLEKNGQKLTASKSKEMRDQELAKQGKAPDGKPQSTAPAKPSFRRDEPAAQRMLNNYPVAHGFFELVSVDESSPDVQQWKYRVYCADRTKHLDVDVPRAVEPDPPKKWGLSQHDHTSSYDFTNAEWSAGYTASGSYIPGLGAKNSQVSGGIARKSFLGAVEGTTHIENNYGSNVLETRFTDPTISANFDWFSGGAKINGITDRIRTTIRRDAKARYETLCFPVAKRTFLLCHFGFSIYTAHYTGQRFRLNCQAGSGTRELIQDDGDFASSGQQGAGPFVYYFSKWMFCPYTETEELVDSFDEYYRNDEYVIKLFLVSERDVREIAPPDGFKAALATLYPALTGGPTHSKTTVIYEEAPLTQFTTSWYGPSDGYDDGGYWNSGQGSDTRAPQSVEDFTTGQSGSAGTSPAQMGYDWTSGVAPRMFGPAVDTTALDSIGLEHIRSTGYSHYLTRNTPGVFSLLANGESIRQLNYSSPEYAQIVTTYLQGAPVPRAVLDSSADFEGGAYVYRYRVGSRSTPTASLDGKPLRKNSAKEFVAAPTQQLHRAWDWGDPRYCRQQLLALGFTAADLTP